MKPTKNIETVAAETTWLHLIWSAWFISIVFIIYIITMILGGPIQLDQENFLAFSYHSSKIYMLIIGIVSVSSFLSYYIKQGITRKAYFLGTVISSVVVSLILTIIIGLVTLVETLIVPTTEIGSFMGLEASWLLTMTVYSLNILIYYTAGSLIGAGFLRFGGLAGMLYIILAVALLFSTDILWQFELSNSLSAIINLNNQWELPLFVSVISTLLLLGIMLWVIHATTKRIPLQMK